MSEELGDRVETVKLSVVVHEVEVGMAGRVEPGLSR